MWSGRPFSYQGEHFVVQETTFSPKPVRQPRIPIWVAAGWGTRRPIRRACRYQGVFPVKWDMTDWTPEEVSRLRDTIIEERGDTEDFDIVIGGSFEAGRTLETEYSEAGATWYLAGPGQGQSLEDLEAAISAG
jgi:alkanesulfonate monooxygenase SsuD/methylene tetrahydromethanopterin reductase-like flavin-dependent oxidoreductase (luciferase family)